MTAIADLPAAQPATNPHASIRPAEVRRGERISATLHRVGGAEASTRVWRISPLAVELVETSWPALPPPGEAVDLTLDLSGQSLRFNALPVHSHAYEGNRRSLVLRWPGGEASEAGHDCVRQRWTAHPDFMPTGTYENRLRYNDTVHFRVVELAPTRMRLLLSLRNKFVIPGMLLPTTVAFPNGGSTELLLRVLGSEVVTAGQRQYLAVDVDLVRPPARAVDLLTNYVLAFSSASSLSEIRAAGLRVRSILPAIDFGHVASPEEYAQVLQLRHLAYSRAGKIASQTCPSTTGDEFDHRARLLVARHHGQMVASMRLVFGDAANRLEHEQYTALPAGLPAREQIIEITRVCTHPDYRGSDLLLGLFRYAIRACAQSGRRWVIGSATERLLPLYTRIGFAPSDVRYEHVALGGETHVLFTADLHATVSGRGVNPVVWQSLYADVLQYTDAVDLSSLHGSVARRHRLYRCLAPAAAVVQQFVALRGVR